jgi:rifampicin phosphotransferase
MPQPDGLVWRFETAHFPGPVTRWSSELFTSTQQQIAARLMGEFGVLLDGVAFREIDGRIYVAAVPLGGRVRRLPLRWLTPVLCRTVPSMRKRMAAAHAADADSTLDQAVDDWLAGKQEDLLERGRAFLVGDLSALDERQVADRLDEQLRFVEECLTWHLRLRGAGANAIGRLGLELTAHHGWSVPEFLDLFIGLSHRTLGPVRAQQAIISLVDDAGGRSSLDAATSLRDVAAISPAVEDAIQSYQDLWGQRAVRYEVAYPTVVERPDWLLRHLKDAARAPSDVEIVTRHESTRHEAEARLLATLGSSSANRRRLERAQRVFPLRDGDEPATIGVPLAGLRRLGLHIGVRLGLYRPDDVFDLTFDETLLALRGGSDSDDPAVLALHRREQRDALLTKEPEPLLGEPSRATSERQDLRGLPRSVATMLSAFRWYNEQVTAPVSPAVLIDHPLVGIGVSPGVYEGMARIIRDEDDFERIEPGDVMVCPSTSPVWAMVFPAIGALVCDEGGTMSHPAIIAREFEVPAVVGVGQATTSIPDGASVRVDGDSGRVTRL